MFSVVEAIRRPEEGDSNFRVRFAPAALTSILSLRERPDATAPGEGTRANCKRRSDYCDIPALKHGRRCLNLDAKDTGL